MKRRIWSAVAAAGMVAAVLPVNTADALLDPSSAIGLSQVDLASAASEANDMFGRALAFGDFDGDGTGDLAIGTPNETVNGRAGSGAVHIAYANGNDAEFTQEGAVPGNAEPTDEFGHALAVGNFNNDAYDDLAIGLPGEAIGMLNNAGYVVVMYGSATGLTAANAIGIQQGGPVPGIPEAGDRFGEALTVGDFDGDNFDDLAIGAPGEGIGALNDAGAVSVLRGSASGITFAAASTFSQLGPIAGIPEVGDRFGAALTAADFNGDNRDDLVVGVPNEDWGSLTDAGILHVLDGSNNGLILSSDTMFSQAGPIAGANEPNDLFGSSLAAGDFDGDGDTDLAVGAPGESVGPLANAGAAMTINNGGSGLVTSGSTLIFQGSPIGETAEAGDRFGYAMAAGALNGDSRDDLVIGAPGENNFAGVAHAMYGSANGLSGNGDQIFVQGANLVDSAEAGDWFGKTIAVGDYDNAFSEDVAIAAPDETVAGSSKAGHVTIIVSATGGNGGGGIDPSDNFQVVDGKIYDPNGDPYVAVGFNAAANFYRNGGLTPPLIQDRDILLNEWNVNMLRLNIYCMEACPGSLQAVLEQQVSSVDYVTTTANGDGQVIMTFADGSGVFRQYVGPACREQLESNGAVFRSGTWNDDVVIHPKVAPNIGCSLYLDIDEIVQAYEGTGTVILIEGHNSHYPRLPQPFEATNTRNFFTDLAEQYKDNPYVWFSPYNEPANECNLPTHGAGYLDANGNPLTEQGVATRSWLDMHVPIINAIRATGNTNMIVPVTTNFGQDRCDASGDFDRDESALLNYGPDMIAADPLGNIIFDLHFYSRWAESTVEQVNTYFNELAALNLPTIVGETGGQCDNGPLSALHAADLKATALLLENYDQYDNPPQGAVHWQVAGTFAVTNAQNLDATRMGPNNDPFNDVDGVDNLSQTGQVFFDWSHPEIDYFGPIPGCG